MKEPQLNRLVAVYKRQLDIGDIQVAYSALVKFVTRLKTRFTKFLGDRFSVSGIFQGYMDYTYFYFTNEFSRERKLKFGLVLNHKDMRFELWLLGQTKSVQEHYWYLLEPTLWIQGEEIPRYSIFEHILIERPDFNDLGALSEAIEASAIRATDQILDSLKSIEGK